jgi:hypothetical protein
MDDKEKNLLIQIGKVADQHKKIAVINVKQKKLIEDMLGEFKELGDSNIIFIHFENRFKQIYKEV